MSSKSDNALSLFTSGYNCAQSILVSFAEDAGIDAPMAFRIASGLGGGIGQTHNICGAINAGAIILGMRFGRYANQNVTGKDTVAKLVGHFVAECHKELGATQCDELLLKDIVDVEERKKKGLKPKICTDAIIKTSAILERFLETELNF